METFETRWLNCVCATRRKECQGQRHFLSGHPKPSDFISVLETLSDRWRWQFTFKSFVDIRHPICLCRSLILVSVMTFTEPWAQIFPSFDMGASRCFFDSATLLSSCTGRFKLGNQIMTAVSVSARLVSSKKAEWLLSCLDQVQLTTCGGCAIGGLVQFNLGAPKRPSTAS